MIEPKAPFKQAQIEAELEPGQVLVKVAGCGVCHTDLGFLYHGVRTKKPMPLTLGHEISGKVVETHPDDTSDLKGKKVVIPAVLPCGECLLCKSGRGNMCLSQIMPGNDLHGGFADHVVVPGKFLQPVSEDLLDKYKLRELSIVADAVTTPFQSIKRSGLKQGELAIFNGVGGIGGYGVQIAKAMGAKVVALDIDDSKLEKMRSLGADQVLNVKDLNIKEIKKTVKGMAKELGAPAVMWKIFETSGSRAGQETAFALLNFGGTVAFIGFTMEKLNIRLSNLMAFDATAFGNWGCLPEYYQDVLQMITEGKINVRDCIEEFPMSQINDVFAKAHKGELERRAVMVPDW